jgi:uncharacterized protein YciI
VTARSDGPTVYHVLVHEAGPAWQPGVPFREQPGVDLHMGFMGTLTETGRMVLGGPFLDGADDAPVGMAVIRAASMEDAERVAQEDPSLATGLIRVRVRPWLVPMRSSEA